MVAAGAAVLVLLSAAAASAAELVIDVTGLASTRGEIHYGVYDDPEAFPKAGRMVAGGKVPAAEAGRIVVTGLAPGRYAVALFHDENGNGEFDRGLFGIPLEPFGFSNDPAILFGPPDFAEAAVTLGPNGAKATVTLD